MRHVADRCAKISAVHKAHREVNLAGIKRQARHVHANGAPAEGAEAVDLMARRSVRAV